MEKTDEFHGQGGAYVMRDGKRVRVEAPTKDHPEGNRPRDADGRPLDTQHSAPSTQHSPAAPANVKPIRGKPASVDQ